MTKSQMLVWLRDTICEAREQGVRGIWDEGGDEYLFREHIESLEKRKWQIILGLNKYAQKLSEPILQEMTTKKKELREAHLQEIRIAATCVKQIMEIEGWKTSLLMHRALRAPRKRERVHE